MKILLGNKGYVDFSSHVFMSMENKKKFICLLKSIFDPSAVIEENTEKFRDWRIGDKIMYPRKWLGEEYGVLLKSNSTEEIVNRLGRSEMAVIVQDGFWRPKYLRWCFKNNKHPFGENMLETIKEYMKESEDLIFLKRKKKKMLNRKEVIIKEIESLKEKIKKLKEREIEFEGICHAVDARDLRKKLEIDLKKRKEELDSINKKETINI